MNALVLSCTPTQDGHALLRVKAGSKVVVVASLSPRREGEHVRIAQRGGQWVLA